MTHNLSVYVFLLLISLSFQSAAQENEDWRLYKPQTSSRNADSLKIKRSDLNTQPEIGRVKIIESNGIKALNELRKEYPAKPDGYRLQIYFGDRKNAQEKRGSFIRKYPNAGAYISYLAPNFRLRVGDFRTRLECEKFKEEIGREYPGCYLVKDKIELPPLREIAEGETE